MERAGRHQAPSRRRPQHAGASLLAPTRTLSALGALGMLAAAGITVAVALAGNPAGAGAHDARPAAVNRPAGALVEPTVAFGAVVPRPLGAVDIAALREAGASVAASATRAGKATGHADAAPVSALASDGIPQTALTAYQNAAVREAALRPACGLTWPLLAGIGRVESDHGRFAGAVLHSDGLSTPPVIGIPLNGHGTALIRDTDGGRIDGDTVYDRAVGPMQFIPSTWATWGVDGNNDGVKDPFNIFDAAEASADYLCAAGRDLTTSHGQVQAILSYNYSWNYVSMVMGLERLYAHAVGITVPVLPTTPDPQHGRPAKKPPLPPVDPGKPRGVPPTHQGSGCPAAGDVRAGAASPSAARDAAASCPPSSPGHTSSAPAPKPTHSVTHSDPAPPPSSGETVPSDPGTPGDPRSQPSDTPPQPSDPGPQPSDPRSQADPGTGASDSSDTGGSIPQPPSS